MTIQQAKLWFPSLWLAIACGCVAAQAAPGFDVASIKPSERTEGGMGLGRSSPDGISLRNASVKSLMARAYGVKDDLVLGGPAWAQSVEFDIEAKVLVPEGGTLPPMNRRRIETLIQSLLADRFKLAVHKETRELPIYELTIAKGGPRLQRAKPGDPYLDGIRGPDGRGGAGMRMLTRDGYFTGQGIALSGLVETLELELHRTIVDKTGLAGSYDITIRIPSETEAEADRSIFTILEEDLGLKLTPARGPVTVLVIDHVERPSEN